jgi:GPI biosynthesis protein family Pig-F
MNPMNFDAIFQLFRGPPPLLAGASSLKLRQQFILSQTIVYCCWIGTIPSQVLLLYDRGYQVQRYPIPVILGCTIGWTVGVLCGTIRAFSCDGRPPE